MSLSVSSDNFFRFTGISAISLAQSAPTFSEDIQFLLSSTTVAQVLPSESLSADSLFAELGEWRALVGRLSTLRRLDIERAPVLDELRGRVGLATVATSGDSSLIRGDSSFENSFICTNMLDGLPLRVGECSFAVTSFSLALTEMDDDDADGVENEDLLRLEQAITANHLHTTSRSSNMVENSATLCQILPNWSHTI